MLGLGLTKHHLSALDREEIQNLDKNTVMIIPTGAIEQHGQLPIATDTMLIEGIATRLAQRFDSRMLITPTVSIGYSHHHFPFPALSLSTQTFTNTLVEIIESLCRSGFSRYLILNAHGGNDELIRTAARISIENQDCKVSAFSYWEPSLPELHNIRERFGRKFTIPGHAGACELSLLAVLYPSLISIERIATKVPASGHDKIPYFSPPYMHFHHSVQTWDGYTDDPRHASVEMGEAFLQEIERALDEVLVKTILS